MVCDGKENLLDGDQHDDLSLTLDLDQWSRLVT